MKRCLLLLATFVFTIWTFAAYAASSTNHLRVGVIETPPFASINPDTQKATGIATSIWEIIAEELHWKYQYISLQLNYQKGIKMLANHQLDVLVGLVPVDHEARQVATFSRPFIISYNALLVNNEKTSFWHLIEKISPKILNYIFAVLIILLLSAHIFWWLEKKKGNPMMLKYPRGVLYATWFMMAAIFTTTFNVPCKPRSQFACFLATLFSSLFIIVVALGAISMTSLLTVSLSKPELIQYSADLKKAPIAAIKDSLEESIGRKYGANIVTIQNLNEGINLLQQNKVIAVLDNYHVLVDYLNNHPTAKIHIANFKINPDELAFAFPQHSSLELPVDIQLTLLQDIGQAEKICKEYLPDAAAEYCAL